MARKNVKVIKVDVEKSEYKSSKTVTIRNMKGELIANLNIFGDGSIFVRECKEVFISEKYVKEIKYEPEENCCEAYHHVIIKDEYNTELINWKKVE